jgi:MFS family permease
MKDNSIKSIILGVALAVLVYYLLSPFFGLLMSHLENKKLFVLMSAPYSFICIFVGASFAILFSRKNPGVILWVGLFAALIINLPIISGLAIEFATLPGRILWSEWRNALFINLFAVGSSFIGGTIAVCVLFALFRFENNRTSSCES